MNENTETLAFFNQRLPEGNLFHYTSPVGLKGMVSGKCLWATNIEFLNDNAEFKLGEKVVKRVLAERKKRANKVESVFFDELEQTPSIFQAKDIFVISLSEDGNLLSQWRGYTPSNCGFSVGFDSKILRDLAMDLRGMKLVRCIYDKKAQLEFARKGLNDFLTHFVNTSTATDNEISFDSGLTFSFKVRSTFAAATMKHHSFSEENEWRLLGVCHDQTQLQFRPGKSSLTPYIELEWGKDSKIPEVQPIRSITVGPCPDPKLSIKSVRRLLDAVSTEGIAVRESRIPFRSW